MDLGGFLTLSVVLTYLYLGFSVYLHDRKSKTNTLFILISIASTLYTIANYISVTVNPSDSLIWIRLTLYFAVPHSVLFFLFIYNFPENKLVIPRRFLYVAAAATMIAMILVVSPFVFSSVDVVEGRAVPQVGPAIPVLGLVTVGSLVAAMTAMIQKYKQAGYIKRRSWLPLFVGVSTTYFLLITLILISVSVFRQTLFVEYAPLMFLPSILGMAYSILRYHLLNVRVVTSEIFVFIIIALSISDVLSASGFREVLLRVSITSLFFVFGISLITSVLREVEQKEELKKLAEELSLNNKRLENLDEAKDEFISMASHQLRTPLTSIKGYISMILDGDVGKVNDKQREFLNAAFTSSERMVYLIADLLNVSRLKTGKFEIEKSKFNLADVVEGEIKQLEEAAKAKKIKLTFNKPSKFPEVEMDETKTRQVIMNFADNAIHYTPKGGKIDIVLSASANKIEYKVIDSGIGVKDSDKKNLFTKFYRSENAKNARPDGTGLGLYMAKKVVAAQDGAIVFESKESKGSTFGFSFPKNKVVPKQ